MSCAKAGGKICLQNRREQHYGRGPSGKIVAPTNIVEFRVVGPDNVEDPTGPPAHRTK